MTKKKQVGVRFDSNRTRLKTGETQRPNGTYAYRWSTPDGKRHSIYAPTLEKLREQEEQIIVDKHDGIRSDVKSITVNEMFDLWCQLKRGIKDSTFKNYIYMYELFVKPSFGKNRLVQVKKSDVRKFYNSLADGKVLKIATIDNVHNVLHQVFQVAVDDGMIRQNPTDNMLKELKLSHGFERDKKEALTVAQQKLFFDYMLSHPKDTHWYPVFYIMANTGMRVGEVCGLTWQDVNLDKQYLTVRRSMRYNGARHKTEIGATKRKKVRTVDFCDTLAAILKAAKTEQHKNRLQYGGLYHLNYYTEVKEKDRTYYEVYSLPRTDEIPEGYKEISFVCLRPDGAYKSPSTVGIMCRTASRKVEGLEGFHFHQLRHTFTSNLLSNGAAPKDVQELLGHADVSTTMNIYAHATREAKRTSARLLDKVVGGE